MLSVNDKNIQKKLQKKENRILKLNYINRQMSKCQLNHRSYIEPYHYYHKYHRTNKEKKYGRSLEPAH
jgi:hypothetical protein